MQDWNVVITIHEKGFGEAVRLLEHFGPVSRTDFFNVLVMRCADINAMLKALKLEIEESPGILNFLSRAVPATQCFNFQSKEEFRAQSKEIILPWAPRLAGKSFHVRMHRRGFKGRLSSMDEERFLNESLLEQLEAAGNPGRIEFANPDAVIAVETVGQRAGLSFWSRLELEDYPFLGLKDKS
jgi:tRNA(Ser,Leu) C12 N-acetylase TAN1